MLSMAKEKGVKQEGGRKMIATLHLWKNRFFPSKRGGRLKNWCEKKSKKKKGGRGRRS